MANARSFASSSWRTSRYFGSSHQKYGASPRTANDQAPGGFGFGGSGPRLITSKAAIAMTIAAQPIRRSRIRGCYVTFAEWCRLWRFGGDGQQRLRVGDLRVLAVEIGQRHRMH